MDLRPIVAGAIVGHEMKIDGEGGLVVEGPDGQAYGSIRPDATPGTVLEAADGSWTVPHVQQYGEKRRAVLDASGTEVAGIQYVRSSRELQLPGGALTWERKTMRPQYRIDGLFGVSRTALHSFVAGLSRQPFKGEITDALTGRPDASLVLLLACWLTMDSIDSKVASAGSSD